MTTNEVIDHLQRHDPHAEVTVNIAGCMGRAREEDEEELQASRAPALDGKLVLEASDIAASESGIGIQVCHRIVFDIGTTLTIWGDVCRL